VEEAETYPREILHHRQEPMPVGLQELPAQTDWYFEFQARRYSPVLSQFSRHFLSLSIADRRLFVQRMT